MYIVALIFAVVGGLLVLAGYFFAPLGELQQLILDWAIIVAGAAMLVGIFNLVLVHATRIQSRAKGSSYSMILLLALLSTFVFGIMLGPDNPGIRRLVNTVVVPAESSLMALLAVSLLYGSVRLLQRRLNLMSGVFLATAALMLIASATLPFGEIGVMSTFVRPWLQHVLALGGARGLLIGVALGTLLTGIRVLIGADRPYQGG